VLCGLAGACGQPQKKKLCDWVVNERAKCMRISTVCVLQESKRIAQEDNIKNFKTYPSGMFRFMKRNNLSVRFSTSVGQKLPFNWKLCLIHNTVFSDTFFCTDNARVIGRKSF